MEILEYPPYNKPAQSSQGRCFCDLLVNIHNNYPGNDRIDWSALETQEQDPEADAPVVRHRITHLLFSTPASPFLKNNGCVPPNLEMISWCHLTFQLSNNFPCPSHSSARDWQVKWKWAVGKAGGRKVKPCNVLGTFELTSFRTLLLLGNLYAG